MIRMLYDGEIEFQDWLTGLMQRQGWQADRLNDQYLVGLPDITAAHGVLEDVWLEAKYAKRVQSVNAKMRLDHGLSPQQRGWLLRRAARSGSYCGVIVGYRTGMVEETIDYVAYVPIEKWKWTMEQDIMGWCLSPRTAMYSWLLTGECTVEDMIAGRLTPGWRGRHGLPARS